MAARRPAPPAPTMTASKACSVIGHSRRDVVIEVAQHGVVGDRVKPPLPQVRAFGREEPLPKIAGCLLAHPKCLVQVLGTANRALAVVGPFKSVKKNPRFPSDTPKPAGDLVEPAVEPFHEGPFVHS